MTDNNAIKYIVTSDKYFGEYRSPRLTDATEVAKRLNEIYNTNSFIVLDGYIVVWEENDTLNNSIEAEEKKEDGGKREDEGKKYDSNKPMVGTLCRVFPNALLAIGNCIEFGTHKYPDPANWQKVDGAFLRYQDSIMRHYLKFLAGQERDSETNLLHLSHMAWNTLAILELYLKEHKDDYADELYK